MQVRKLRLNLVNGTVHLSLAQRPWIQCAIMAEDVAAYLLGPKEIEAVFYKAWQGDCTGYCTSVNITDVDNFRIHLSGSSKHQGWLSFLNLDWSARYMVCPMYLAPLCLCLRERAWRGKIQAGHLCAESLTGQNSLLRELESGWTTNQWSIKQTTAWGLFCVGLVVGRPKQMCSSL